MKILYGRIYDRSDFDKVIRLIGTRTRIACKGKEWFMLSAKFRVIGIYNSLRAAKEAYPNLRNYQSAGTLHYISCRNHGRCSRAESRIIFEEWKAGR